MKTFGSDLGDDESSSINIVVIIVVIIVVLVIINVIAFLYFRCCGKKASEPVLVTPAQPIVETIPSPPEVAATPTPAVNQDHLLRVETEQPHFTARSLNFDEQIALDSIPVSERAFNAEKEGDPI